MGNQPYLVQRMLVEKPVVVEDQEGKGRESERVGRRDDVPLVRDDLAI